jgi:hypothetical protein
MYRRLGLRKNSGKQGGLISETGVHFSGKNYVSAKLLIQQLVEYMHD